MPETSKPVDEREREAKKVGESAAAAPQGPVHSKSASGGSTEKALRFREEPEVREVPALPEEPSDIEEGKAGEGDLQARYFELVACKTGAHLNFYVHVFPSFSFLCIRNLCALALLLSTFRFFGLRMPGEGPSRVPRRVPSHVHPPRGLHPSPRPS